MGYYTLLIISVYFGIIWFISHIVSRKSSGNEAFFMGNRKSPWYIVAIGMLGDSISGVTFVSVPGMAGVLDMTYMQMVIGFFFGYIVVTSILLPLYYKLHLVSIYAYLEQRFGMYSYKTGAVFFILSRLIGTASKLYLVILILQSLVFNDLNIPFYLTVALVVFLIWVYTFRSGMKTIVWTDVLQTVCLVSALMLIIWQVASKLGFEPVDVIRAVQNSEHSRIFVFDNWKSSQNFFKQFFSGVFIVIVMTGLDQNMMQKNLTCRSLKDAQKNMLTYGFGFIPLNYLFLTLGILLLLFAENFQIALPGKTDEILPALVSQHLGLPALLCFTIGIVAASFSNADSALTSLTTSACVDLLNTEKQDKQKAGKIRQSVHILMSLLLLVSILFINRMGNNSILDVVYKAVSYTYGPLLGLFFIGLFSRLQLKDKYVPWVCFLAPIASYLFEWILLTQFQYKVGYEILLFNGFVTAVGLRCIAR
jgi:Na+/proline symporter